MKNNQDTKVQNDNWKLLEQVQDTGLGEHLDTEDLKWRQRIKQHWLSNRDRNMKFFHTYANQKRKNNRIRQLKDPNGRIPTSQFDFCIFFSQLFHSSFQHI